MGGRSDRDWERHGGGHGYTPSGAYDAGFERTRGYDRDFDEMGSGFPSQRGRRDESTRGYGRSEFDRDYDQGRFDEGRYGWRREGQRFGWRRDDGSGDTAAYGEPGRGYDFQGDRGFADRRGREDRDVESGRRFDEDRGQRTWYGRGRDAGDERRYGWQRFSGDDRERFARREQPWHTGRGGSEFSSLTGQNYTTEWRRPGPFSGRGPRGFRISDDRIREQVSERLYHHGDIDASDIDVRVDNGEVTLEGWVDDRRTKRLAEDVADEVDGVQEVHNHLRIRRGRQGDQGIWAQRSAAYGQGQDRAFDMTGTPGSPVDGRQYGSTGTGAGLNMTTNTGSGMDTGTTLRTGPGMHSDSGTGTSGMQASGMGTTGQPGVGSITGAAGTTLDPAAGTTDTTMTSRTATGMGSSPVRQASAASGADTSRTSRSTRFASAVSRQNLGMGTDVFDAEGNSVGTVKEVRANDFLLDRPMARDLYVPFSAVQSTDGGRVTLNVPDDQFDAQGWEAPPLIGNDPGTEARDRGM
jgi:hypothetical protein